MPIRDGMTKDKRAITSRENGRKGGRPPTQPESLKIPLCIRLTPSQANWVNLQGGSAYIRALIEKDKRNPAG